MAICQSSTVQQYDYSESSTVMKSALVRVCALSLQLSDLDERVLDELLSDPRFVESLLEQGVKFGEEREEDNVDGGVPNSTVVDHQPPTNSSGLAVAGARVPGGGSSLYESATMQVVEQLQDSVRGLLAKVSAAIESAGRMGLFCSLCRLLPTVGLID